MFTLVLLAANLIAAGLLLRHGARFDRIAIGLVAFGWIGTMLLQPVQIHHWRLGVAIADTVLLVGFWILAERAERWWLVAIAGFQLIAVLSYLIPLAVPGYLVRSGVTIRLAVWSLISLTLFIGAWEAWADRRYRLKEACHA